MLFTSFGMTEFLQPSRNLSDAVSMMPLQLSRESYFGLSPATEIQDRSIQPTKEEYWILVTLLGMWMLVRPLQTLKAYSTMDVTPSGMTVLEHPRRSVLLDVLMRALQLPRESYVLLPSSTVMLFKEPQSKNASLPMLVTLEGIVMLVRGTCEKEDLPMLFKFFGKMMLVREVL